MMIVYTHLQLYCCCLFVFSGALKPSFSHPVSETVKGGSGRAEAGPTSAGFGAARAMAPNIAMCNLAFSLVLRDPSAHGGAPLYSHFNNAWSLVPERRKGGGVQCESERAERLELLPPELLLRLKADELGDGASLHGY